MSYYSKPEMAQAAKRYFGAQQAFWNGDQLVLLYGDDDGERGDGWTVWPLEHVRWCMGPRRGSPKKKGAVR
jgi:hypothetical protein